MADDTKTNEILKNAAISALSTHIETLTASRDKKDNKRARLLSYWIKDYISFLKKEENFIPSKYIKYKRGDVVKVHLGYNVGSEEGGLHYAVIMDMNNSKNSDTVTVIPLSSVRENRKIHHTSILIGNEIFKSITSKHDSLLNHIKLKIGDLDAKILSIIDKDPQDVSLDELRDNIKDLERRRNQLDSLRKEIARMQRGSVALVGQITTISKIRIYDPMYTHNVLYGIRLQPTTLSLINDKIKELYVY